MEKDGSHPQKTKFWPFDQARDFVREIALKSWREWNAYCRSGEKPDYIPANPRSAYKQKWQGVGDWLGTGNRAYRNREYWSFEEARAFVRARFLKNEDAWYAYCRSGEKPVTIPSNPHRTYKQEWQSLGDWLGTGTKP